MKIDRAQTRGPSARHIGGGLENIELRPKSRGEIAFGEGKRIIRGLHDFCLRLEDAIGLLQIKKGAAHFGFDPELDGLERKESAVTPRARRLHPAAGGETVKDAQEALTPTT